MKMSIYKELFNGFLKRLTTWENRPGSNRLQTKQATRNQCSDSVMGRVILRLYGLADIPTFFRGTLRCQVVGMLEMMLSGALASSRVIPIFLTTILKEEYTRERTSF